jgi:NAD-dependent deacetylase
MREDDGILRARDAIAAFIASCDRLVIFTGAGISTEVGVPDFRSPGSPWLTHKPVPFQDYIDSAEARIEAWRRKFAMDDIYRHFGPGATHQFIAEGVARGQVSAVVTQNIDNLHQRSGIADDKIIELHGNGSYARCMQCERRHEIPAIRTHFDQHGYPPVCDDCGGIVKSATISFGQKMPTEALRRAREAMIRADGVIVLGSSLVVRPAADLPLMAKEGGARLLIVNREKTPLDSLAECVIRGDLPSVLPEFWPLTDINASSTSR